MTDPRSDPRRDSSTSSPSEAEHTVERALDRIEIDELRLRTVIGIFDHERDRRQEVRVHLTLFTDTRPAARSDDIAATLDYKEITKRIIDLVEESSFFLLETLVNRIADVVVGEFGAPRVTVRVEKPGALRHARTVAVQITRCAAARAGGAS